jgi:hypothetical protein
VGTFWSAVSGKLADRWATLSAPALVFWLGGLLAWAYSKGGFHELTILTHWLNKQTAATQIAVLLAALLSVAASAVVVSRLTFPVLRLLEGYWPRPLGWLRTLMVQRIQRRAAADDAAMQRLAPLVLGSPTATHTATAGELAKFVRLDQRRRRRPGAASRLLPTRLGNILCAAETWPDRKYGLDAVVVWPRLWLVLSDSTRQELIAARAALDSTVNAAIWGLLFCFFAIWTPLALVPGLGVPVAAIVVWAPSRAEIFADLVEAAYDLYRTALYQQLRWPLPESPAQEIDQGKQLTAYLWRGAARNVPTFTPPS